jgi:hypothetical protein
MMKRIKFGDKEWEQCIEFALIRIRESAKRNLHDRFRHPVLTTDTPEGKLKIDLMGVIGEWATASALGFKYEFTVNSFAGPDLILPNGREVQVKATDKPYGCLLVKPIFDKDNNLTPEEITKRLAEPYILATIDFKTRQVDVKGWVTAYEAYFMAACYPGMIEAKYGLPSEAVYVPQDLLRPLDTVWTERGLTEPYRGVV